MPPPALQILLLVGTTNVDEWLVIPPSPRTCHAVPSGCHLPNTLNACARESIAAKLALRSVYRAPTLPCHQRRSAYSTDKMVERLLSLSLMPVPVIVMLGRRSARTQRISARASP